MKRPGKTVKVSISLDRSDLEVLRRRATRLHGGNLSAALAEGVRRLREEEGRQALLAWLGEASAMTPDQRAEIAAEWRGGRPRRRGRSAA